MLLVGLIIGRAWVVPLGAVAWAALVLVVGSIDAADLPVAALLGGVNALVGVAVHRVLLLPLKRRVA
jgi:hypothetical protein